MKKRATIGYIIGESGRFDQRPFYTLRITKPKAKELDQLLARAGSANRNTTTLTASYQQPERLRITETQPPDYELRAAPFYVRGDVVRVQGTEGVSCGLDISARFGIPLLREQLAKALSAARNFVELRVPSRKRDMVEFVPDTDPRFSTELSADDALTQAQINGLEPEDFSDWEN